MRLKGFERIDLQNLIRYKQGSELQAEIRSSARSPSRRRGHGMCTTLCPEVFAINDDGYAEGAGGSRRPGGCGARSH